MYYIVYSNLITYNFNFASILKWNLYIPAKIIAFSSHFKAALPDKLAKVNSRSCFPISQQISQFCLRKKIVVDFATSQHQIATLETVIAAATQQQQQQQTTLSCLRKRKRERESRARRIKLFWHARSLLKL